MIARSSLAPRTATDPVELTRALGGVHAQVQVSAELQLANRLAQPDRGEIRRALWEERTLVKAWTIRGTLHLHAADELALWLAARRAVSGPPEGLPEWRDPNGVLHPAVSLEDAEAARAAVWETLGDRCLTREELAAEVVPQVGPAVRSRLLSGFAFFLGGLCQGPPRGAKVTVARPDRWVAGWREVDPADALAEVCRRYVRAFGPVRPGDFQEWFGTKAPAPVVEQPQPARSSRPTAAAATKAPPVCGSCLSTASLTGSGAGGRRASASGSACSSRASSRRHSTRSSSTRRSGSPRSWGRSSTGSRRVDAPAPSASARAASRAAACAARSRRAPRPSSPTG